MSATTVIHYRDFRHDDRYIGRAVPRLQIMASPWANPFPLLREGNRAEVVARFEEWVRFSDDPRARWIRSHLEELRGQRLACWRAPRLCHGNVYVKMLSERSWP